MRLGRMGWVAVGIGLRRLQVAVAGGVWWGGVGRARVGSGGFSCSASGSSEFFQPVEVGEPVVFVRCAASAPGQRMARRCRVPRACDQGCGAGG
ncbi:MAG: hypothetical protein KatS3mg132_131 [Limisphaera sp.]|nr:MAG: hypothetical protein KatS3mg132_131 [Limisphaera sp.]